MTSGFARWVSPVTAGRPGTLQAVRRSSSGLTPVSPYLKASASLPNKCAGDGRAPALMFGDTRRSHRLAEPWHEHLSEPAQNTTGGAAARRRCGRAAPAFVAHLAWVPRTVGRPLIALICAGVGVLPRLILNCKVFGRSATATVDYGGSVVSFGAAASGSGCEV